MFHRSNIITIFLIIILVFLLQDASSYKYRRRKKTYINQRIKKVKNNRFLNCPCGYYKQNFEVI